MKKIIRLKEVVGRTGLSRSTIYAKCAVNQFPQSIQLTERAVGWLEEEIDDWIGERVATRTVH